jgi:uncharacterized membrane protein YesL
MNILWVLFTLLGGVVFGIIPSTVAMFAIARKTAMGEEDIPVFKTYWGTYRSEFLRSNLLGLILTVMGLVGYFDLHFFRQFEGSIYTLMNFAMMMLGMVFFILLIYVFPVYVHYDLKLYQYLTYALKIGFLRPSSVVFMFVGTICTYYFLIYLPGLIPLFGITFFVYFNMWIALKSFQNIEEVSNKKNNLLV